MFFFYLSLPTAPSIQLQWINKTLFDVLPITDFKTYSSYEPDYEEAHLEENIKKYFVSEDDINQHKVGTQKKYVKKAFLELHGILKDSTIEKYFSNNFFNGKSLNELIREGNTKVILTNTSMEYILCSFNDNSREHNTYYIFVHSE